MGGRANQVDQEDDFDEEEDGEELVMDDDSDFDLDIEAEDGEAALSVRPRRAGAWRLIEEATERRLLKRALEDFEDYVI